MSEPTPLSPKPWWKFGHVWLVISGPAIVVVASFITMYLAMTRADPVLDEDYYRKGVNINKTLPDHPGSMVPAMQGRNHLSSDLPSAGKTP